MHWMVLHRPVELAAIFGHSAWSFCGVQNEGFGRCTAARFLGKMKWQQIGATKRTDEETTHFGSSRMVPR
jgi:hypothetical protein